MRNFKSFLEAKDINAVMAGKYNEEVELEELTAAEKKLINQMYDKKGNLTPMGKKVMTLLQFNVQKTQRITQLWVVQRLAVRNQFAQ